MESVGEWTNNCSCVFTKIQASPPLKKKKKVYLVLVAKRVSVACHWYC